MAKKVKILRDYGSFKKGSSVEVTENVAQFVMENSIASFEGEVVKKKSDCEDCNGDCEDCKGKKKKRTPKKSAEKKPTKTTKKAPKK